MPWETLRKRSVSLVLTITVGYSLALVVLRILEPYFVFFPNYAGRLSGDWQPRGLPVQDVWVTSSDGTKLFAWWIPNDKAKFTFLAFHGNAGNLTSRSSVYSFLWNTPANVLAMEYPGYGRSEGKPGERAFYRSADAAYVFLVKTQGIDPKRIVSFGQSVGTPVAAHLATHHEVGAVVLEAPLPSVARIAQRVFWFFPGLGLLVKGQFDTLQSVKTITAPKLIVHCTEDPVIPPELEEEVYEAASPPKSLLKINSYCHEESSLIAPGEYRKGLQALLASVHPKY